MFKGLLESMAPIVALVIRKGLTMALRAMVAKDAARAELLCVSIYPVIDTELESFTDGTDTKLDDAAVDGIKGAIEDVAKDNEWDLPNIDED